MKYGKYCYKTGKQIWKHELVDVAIWLLQKETNTPMSAYRCPHCKEIHLTTKGYKKAS